MPILSIHGIAAGSALLLRLSASAGTKAQRLLRNTTGAFSGYNDPAATLLTTKIVSSFLDYTVTDGVTYSYQLFAYDGTAWRADGPVVQAVSAATFQPQGGDALLTVRDRLDLGLEVLRARGVLKHSKGHIPVLTAPPIKDEVDWPVVTVHLAQDVPQERGIGEMPEADEFDVLTEQWESFEGWLSNVQLTIMGWSYNPDERIALRRAIKSVLIANLAVFNAAGVQQVEVQQSDSEDFQSYGAPVYQVMTTFRCVAPSVVAMPDRAITDVIVNPTVISM